MSIHRKSRSNVHVHARGISRNQSLGELMAEYVIALTIGKREAYVARPGAEFDGSWFTRDIGKAKTYKLERNANKRIAEHGSAWDELKPRAVIKSLLKV